MIEEVNGASASLSKTNRADEPVSSFVHVIVQMQDLKANISFPSKRFRRLSVSSTRTCLSCNSSTRVLLSCSPRSPLPKRLANQFRLDLVVTGTTALVWVEETLPLTSIGPTWEDGRQ